MKKMLYIPYSEILLFTFFLFYFQPVIIERISSKLDMGLRITNILLFLLIVFVRTIRNRGFMINTRFNILFVIFNIWNFFCIMFMAPNIAFDYFKEVVYILEFWAILNLYSDEKDYVWNALGAVSRVYILINSLSLMLFPKGIFFSHMGSSIERAQWILGSKNNIALYTIIFLMFIHIKAHRIDGSYTFIIDSIAFFSVACSGSSGLQLMGGSSTGMAACGMCVCLLALNRKIKFERLRIITSMRRCVMLLVFLNITFLFGTMSFGNFVSKLFNKKLVYGGRIPIWQSCMHLIAKSPLLGYGYNRFGYRIFNGTKIILTTYTYNTILGIWIRYGIVSVVLLAIVILSVTNRNSYTFRMIMCVFLSLGVWGIMNELDLRYIFIPLLCIEVFCEKERYPLVLRDRSFLY